MRLRSSCKWFLAFVAILAVCGMSRAEEKIIRVGIIGLDTSHVVAFTKAFNAAGNTGDLAGIKVVAAFPGGSRDIPDGSWKRVPGYTEELRGMGVEIVESIDALLPKVDAVLLESNDGRKHLPQVIPVFKARKRVFIDKPVAASLTDALEIYHLSKQYDTPVFSCSSARFTSGIMAFRTGESSVGEIKRVSATSGMSLEPHHPDLAWYGIHGVEVLFTILGPDCRSVERPELKRVEGHWGNGAVGVFTEKGDIGATVEGTEGQKTTGVYEGYVPLLREIAKFFKTGKPPVDPEETIAIMAFIMAADESKAQGGKPVSIESVMQKAKKEQAERTAAQ